MTARTSSGSHPFFALASILLGLLVAVLGFFALLMWVDARQNREARTPVVSHAGHETTGSLTSYAGASPGNADALAAAHKPYPATLPAAPGGVFMYPCDTKPVLMHIANGMYGAIVVEPKPGVLPKADKNYVLVASEWYLSSDGLTTPAQFNIDKAHARQPDWMTFNGYAGQYVKHPLVAKPGELVRFWVVDA